MGYLSLLVFVIVDPCGISIGFLGVVVFDAMWTPIETRGIGGIFVDIPPPLEKGKKIYDSFSHQIKIWFVVTDKHRYSVYIGQKRKGFYLRVHLPISYQHSIRIILLSYVCSYVTDMLFLVFFLTALKNMLHDM